MFEYLTKMSSTFIFNLITINIEFCKRLLKKRILPSHLTVMIKFDLLYFVVMHDSNIEHLYLQCRYIEDSIVEVPMKRKVNIFVKNEDPDAK